MKIAKESSFVQRYLTKKLEEWQFDFWRKNTKFLKGLPLTLSSSANPPSFDKVVPFISSAIYMPSQNVSFLYTESDSLSECQNM